MTSQTHKNINVYTCTINITSSLLSTLIRSERLTFWRQVLAGVGLAAQEDLVQDDAEAVDVACLAAAAAA